jgi:hypothetical protein
MTIAVSAVISQRKREMYSIILRVNKLKGGKTHLIGHKRHIKEVGPQCNPTIGSNHHIAS